MRSFATENSLQAYRMHSAANHIIFANIVVFMFKTIFPFKNNMFYARQTKECHAVIDNVPRLCTKYFHERARQNIFKRLQLFLIDRTDIGAIQQHRQTLHLKHFQYYFFTGVTTNFTIDCIKCPVIRLLSIIKRASKHIICYKMYPKIAYIILPWYLSAVYSSNTHRYSFIVFTNA